MAFDIQINPEDIGSFTDAEQLERAKSKRYRPGYYGWITKSVDIQIQEKDTEWGAHIGDYSLTFGFAALQDRQDVGSVHWLGQRGGVRHWLTLPVKNARVDGHKAPEEEYRAHKFLRALKESIFPAWPETQGGSSVLWAGESYPISEYDRVKTQAHALVQRRCGELLLGEYKSLVGACVAAELQYKTNAAGRENPRLKDFTSLTDPRIQTLSFVDRDSFVDD